MCVIAEELNALLVNFELLFKTVLDNILTFFRYSMRIIVMCNYKDNRLIIYSYNNPQPTNLYDRFNGRYITDPSWSKDATFP